LDDAGNHVGEWRALDADEVSIGEAAALLCTARMAMIHRPGVLADVGRRLLPLLASL